MPSPTTSPSLLSRVRNPQDRAAWRTFEARYRDLILVYARRRGLQSADAEDVLQAVMLSLSRALPAFHYSPAKGRFRSYLGRVVQNAVQRSFSRPGLRPELLDQGDLETLARMESPLDSRWEREWIDHHYRTALRAIRRSHEPRTMAVFDALLKGEEVKAVAARFDLTEAAVHKVRQRMRRELREQVDRQVRDEDEPDATRE